MNQQISPQQLQAQWLQAVIGFLITVAVLAMLVQKVIKEFKGIKEELKH